MQITLIGNRTREHLHFPGTPGIVERDGGPVAVAEAVLSEFADVGISTVTSGVASWVDVSMEEAGAVTIVTNSPVKVRGILDANAFLVLPITAREFTFDQLELLSGKIAISGTGLTRVLNSKTTYPIAIGERFLPLIDIFLLPWADRGLMDEATLKELKKKHILILTKGANGVDIYDHGTKHSLPANCADAQVLVMDQDACFLASFVAHFLRTKDVVVSATFACDAVAIRLKDPNNVPLPPKVQDKDAPGVLPQGTLF